MLMLTMMILISMLLTSSVKKSWEVSIMTIITTNFMMMMLVQMTDNTFMLSNFLIIDTMTMTMMVLTLWITSMMISCNFNIKNSKMFMLTISMLLINLMMLFSINNLILFYILFELSIMPVLLLIMVWGVQAERKTASFFITLYTITASLPLLIMILSMMKTNHHSNISHLSQMMPMAFNSYTTWLMLITAFLIKLPLFSLHLWLPKAHVEAPLAGSMILAAILLKLGGYGLLRINKIFYCGVTIIPNIMISISSMGMVITNIMCIRQTDLKSLIAYSSVSHMALMIISTNSNSKLGLYGSLMIMLSHGLTSSSMFLLTNMMYEKVNSRNIMLMKGNLMIAPIAPMMWMITSSLNMAVPPSLNIFSEIIIMMSTMVISKSIMFMMMMSSFTTAAYSLYMYSMISHGNQLKISCPTLLPTSMIMTNWFSHSWPLIMLLIYLPKLMTWC